MGDLLIRNIPDALKREIVQLAETGGHSLSAEAIELLRKGIAVGADTPAGRDQSGWQALRSAFEAAGPLDDEFANVMEETELARKKDFGRSYDFE